MPLGIRVQDASLQQTFTLPASTSPITSTGFQLPVSSRSDFVADGDFYISAPALNSTQLPDGSTITYSLQSDVSAAFGSPTTVETLGVQTGAGGAGAAAVTFRFRLASITSPFVRAVATPANGAGNCSGASATCGILV